MSKIYEDVSEDEIQYSENDLWLLDNVHCGVCGKPLKGSKHINFVTLNKKATWKEPVWGNILVEGSQNRAGGFVCDPCIDKKNTNMAMALEIGDNKSYVKYHPVSELEDVDPIQVCPRCKALGYWVSNRCYECGHTWPKK